MTSPAPTASTSLELEGDAAARFAEAMSTAAERLGAAEVLARAPHRAEAMHVLARALQALEAAAAELNQAHAEPVASVSELADRRAQLERAPEADARLLPDDLRLLRTTAAHARRVHARLARLARPRRVVMARRLALAGAAVALAVAIPLSLSRLHDRLEVTASGSNILPLFSPENAIDGHPEREWLTPDGSDGWVQVDLRPALRVRAVRLTNARNPPYNDRASKDVDVELYRGDKVVAKAQTTFEAIDTAPVPRTIPIAADGVTRVRVTIRSHHGQGAGLAEIELVEPAR